MSHLGVTGTPGDTRVRPWGDRDPPNLGGFQVEAVTGTLWVTMEKPPGEKESGKGPFGVTVSPLGGDRHPMSQVGRCWVAWGHPGDVGVTGWGVTPVLTPSGVGDTQERCDS